MNDEANTGRNLEAERTGRMSERIIIENRTDLPMADMIKHVHTVIEMGRISKTSKGKQYCFGVTFWDGTVVWSDKNKASDRFVVSMQKGQDDDRQ